MKTIKGYVVLKETELRELEVQQYDDGVKDGESFTEDRIESLEKGIKKKEKTIEILDRELGDANLRVEVLEEERDDVRDVVKQQIANADEESSLQAIKDGLDKREAKLKDRAARLEEDEAGEYKKGYADGVADGVRKISEITQEDRNQAMKVAMVAAASHSTPEVIKELSRGTNQLTEGITDSED